MILPVEADDALDALRHARTQLGFAVDALNELHAPLSIVGAYTKAHDAASWSVEQLSVVLAATSSRARMTREMVDVEERPIEGATFEWAEDEQ